MADDLGYETIGINGGTSYQTPGLDRLAAGGMRFTQMHAQPLCTPSRVKIMTGRYNLWNYREFSLLPKGERTFGHLLREAGYQTLVAGKWQLVDGSGGTEGQYPEEAGFGEHVLWQLRREGRGSRYWDPTLVMNGQKRVFPGAFGPDVVTDAICDFMKRHRRQPFFVYYPMILPHRPFVATPDSPNAYSKEERFAGMVSHVDKMVTKIVDQVKALGLVDRTVILFTGDNGTSGEIVSRMGSREIPGGKGKPIDSGTHVPFFAHWPGVIPAASVNDNIMDFTVFVPTLCEIAGIAAPDNADGHSILGQLLGTPERRPGWIYSSYRAGKKYPFGPAEYARTTRFKLHFGGEFFDLVDDPMEESAIPAGQGSEAAEHARLLLRQAMEGIRAADRTRSRLPGTGTGPQAGRLDQSVADASGP